MPRIWRFRAGGGSRTLHQSIEQVQTDAPAFTMPISVLVTTTSGSRREILWNDRSDQTFQLIATGKAADVKSVSIDPDGWILKRTSDELQSG